MSEHNYTKYVVEAVSEIARIPESNIDPKSAIADLGLDSLDTVEILMVMDDKLGIETDARVLDGANSIEDLAARYEEIMKTYEK